MTSPTSPSGSDHVGKSRVSSRRVWAMERSTSTRLLAGATVGAVLMTTTIESTTDNALRRHTSSRSPMPDPTRGADRTKVLSVRFTAEEFDALSERAADVGVGPSTLARTFVRQALA